MTRPLGALLLLGGIVFAQDTPARPRITGIDHVAFRVSDAAAARRFYGDLLGLVERGGAGERAVAYGVGMRQAIVVEPGLGAGDEERLSHLAFATPDLDAMSAYLTSRGIGVRPVQDRQHPRAIHVTDPDGHTIEFVQADWPPPAAAGADPSHALSDRLLHAGLIVADETRAHTFYRETLGFTEMWRGGRPAGVTQWVNMRVADGTDYLEYMLAAAAPDRRQRGVMHHVCLRVPDMQQAWEDVARRSATLKLPLASVPQIGVNGRFQLNLYDHDGTRTELMEAFTVR